MKPLVFVLAYLLITLMIGFFARKKGGGSRLFHGANLGVLMCVAAGAGEWMGGTSTTGVSEYGYLFGISGAWYTIANGIGIMFCAFFFARLYRSLNTPTVPGIVGHFIGPKARKAASVILIVVMIVVGISQMVAIGSLGQVLFHIDIRVSILVLGIAVITYTLFGGMASVSQTNTMHLIVMYTGILAAVGYCLTNTGGITALSENLTESYFSFTAIGGTKIGSWVIASVLGACTAQAGIQPILAAKDEKVAFRSSVIIALIVAPFGIMTALLGMIARVLYPELENAKIALPVLMQGLPVWISGLVTAAMTAAILSTASPILLACGTLFTRDLYLAVRPQTDDKKELVVSRIATTVAGLICIAAAIALFDLSTVLDVVYFAYSLRGSLFVILLFGIWSKKTKPDEKLTVFSMVLTAVIGLYWVVHKAQTGSYPISSLFSDTYVTVCVAVLSMGAVSLYSRVKRSRKRS